MFFFCLLSEEERAGDETPSDGGCMGQTISPEEKDHPGSSGGGTTVVSFIQALAAGMRPCY